MISPETMLHALRALQNHKFAEARTAMEQAKPPLTLQDYLIRGLAEMGCDAWDAAAETFRAATIDFPDHAAFWANRGLAEEKNGDDASAADSYRRALTLHPADGMTHGNLSNVLYRMKNAVAAEHHACAAIEHGAPQASALNSLGLALARQRRFTEAESAFTQARQIDPADPLIALNIANTALDQMKLPDAWAAFDDALRLGAHHPMLPEMRRDAGMARLLAGDYSEGWNLYEARLEIPRALHRPCSLPRFVAGSTTPQRILIMSEQGQGDTIQFCRYGKILAAQGHTLIWMVQPSLVRLLSGHVVGQVISHNDVLPDADCYIPMLSLPRATGLLNPSDAPAAPYLTAQHTHALPHADHRPKVGLVWAGSPTHRRDDERSIPFALLRPLWERTDIQFYAPFMGDALNAIGDAPVHRLDHLISDFADTAGFLMQMDRVVTVDTAVAHLAGALGIRTTLMLPPVPDWRWGLNTTTTPWYPTMTILRAAAYGDWEIQKTIPFFNGLAV